MNAFQKLLFGKMSVDPSAATTEMTSTLSSKSSVISYESNCLRLDLTSGQVRGRFWESAAPSHGASWMPNIGESPNVDVESSLSAILEDNPHQKYVLSRRACEGILRRAKRRGKDLPERLEKALMEQVQHSELEHTNQMQ